MEASSFRTQFDFLSVDLNLLRRWNLGLWRVTYFLLMMKKVREREREEEGKREGGEGKEGGRERESKQESHRERTVRKSEQKRRDLSTKQKDGEIGL